MTHHYPVVTIKGRQAEFVAFVQLSAASTARVRYCREYQANRWRCDECGNGADPFCLHTFAAAEAAADQFTTSGDDMPRTYLLTDDSGSPLGMVDMDQITTAGTRMAFEFAANCDDEHALNEITARYMTQAGTESFGYVATCALGIMTREVLSGVLQVTDALKVDLRTGIADLAAGRDPKTGGAL